MDVPGGDRVTYSLRAAETWWNAMVAAWWNSWLTLWDDIAADLRKEYWPVEGLEQGFPDLPDPHVDFGGGDG